MKPPRLPSIFRGLVVASITASGLVLASPWLIWDSTSLETYEALLGRGVGAVLKLSPVVLWLLVALRLAVAIGLCRFNPRARFVFASLAGFDLLLLLLSGVMTGTATKAFLATGTNLMNGAIIALAYFSPVRKRFGFSPKRRPQKLRQREAEQQQQPTAVDRLSSSSRIQRLRQDHLGAVRSRPHDGICRTRFVRSVRDALSRCGYFRKAKPETTESPERETQNHAA